MAVSSQEKFKLKKLLKELSKYRGRHTELVTVLVPAGYDLNKIINHLAQEQGTASNIKSASTRKNVQDALERMIQHLRLYKKTPDNGLAVFSGNVAEREGQSDVKVWSFEPPVTLNTRIYRCDKTFVIEPIEDMMEVKEIFGLVVMDRRDAMLAVLKGKAIVPIVKTHSEVPGKFKAGGQCLTKDTKIRLEKNLDIPLCEVGVGQKISSFDFKKNLVRTSMISNKWKSIKTILYVITTKHSQIEASKDHLFFVKAGDNVNELPAEKLKIGDVLFYIDANLNRIESNIIEIKVKKGRFNLVDISVGNQNFIANGVIVHNSAARFASNRELAAKQHYKKIGEYMKEQWLGNANLKGILVGGPGPTKYDFVDGNFITNELKLKIIAIKDLSYTEEFGLQELLEKSQDVLSEEEVADEKKVMQKFFDLLNTKPKMVNYGISQVRENLAMGTVDILLLSEDLDDEVIEEFDEKARELGTTVKIISTETREGVQLRDIGKIAAILRYEVQT